MEIKECLHTEETHQKEKQTNRQGERERNGSLTKLSTARRQMIGDWTFNDFHEHIGSVYSTNFELMEQLHHQTAKSCHK